MSIVYMWGGGGGVFQTYHFSLIFELMYLNLYNISVKFSLQLLFFNKLCKIVCLITYFLPDERVVKIVQLARQNCNITILGVSNTPKPPCSYGPECMSYMRSSFTSSKNTLVNFFLFNLEIILFRYRLT
jgi:hypothetical protein